MDIDWFRDLGLLAQSGNFSRAAKLANISQPAFSRRIKALEAWVNAELVDRSRQPVSLTTVGRQMLEAGQQAIARIEHERAQIREALSAPEKYVVTFGAPHSIGWRFYPAWLQAFENGFGPLLSRLRADDLPSCIDALKDGEIDFVISYRSRFERGVPGALDTESLSIGEDMLVPDCKPDPAGKPIFEFEGGDGLKIPWLRFGDAATMSRHLDPLLEKTGLRDRLGVVYENSMSGALRIRARDGLGVTWLPQSLVRPDLDAGHLVVTGRTDWWVPLEIRLHRLRDNNNPLTREIWSFLSGREQIPLQPVSAVETEFSGDRPTASMSSPILKQVPSRLPLATDPPGPSPEDVSPPRSA